MIIGENALVYWKYKIKHMWSSISFLDYSPKYIVIDHAIEHINNHAGAAPAQIGMKTGRRKIARFLVKSA